MRAIIAGSPGIPALAGQEPLRIGVERARAAGIEITEIVCGNSSAGIDKYVRDWAAENSLPLKTHSSDGGTNRAFGGYMHNCALVESGVALIAITMGTTGIEQLIQLAGIKGLPVFIIEITHESSPGA